jgi:hypothetical protein
LALEHHFPYRNGRHEAAPALEAITLLARGIASLPSTVLFATKSHF